MILSIDVESSGLPQRGMQVDDPKYPWPVSIGAVLFDHQWKDHACFHTRIRKPEGKHISAGAQAVHGISTRDASKSGISEITALAVVSGLVAQATHLVGYNIEFDRGIIYSSLLRLGSKNIHALHRPGLQVIDLMPAATALCRIESGREDGQFKWPTTDEASAIRGERPRHGHHNALEDATRAKRLFISLLHRGMLDLELAA